MSCPSPFGVSPKQNNIRVTFSKSIYLENPKSNRKTFYFLWKSHFRIHTAKAWFFFVSNKSQESIKNTDIFVSLSTDHSPIFFTLRWLQVIAKGKSLWVFNSSLILNKEFVEKMKEHISIWLNLLEKENILDELILDD